MWTKIPIGRTVPWSLPSSLGWCCFALYEKITVPGAGFWSKCMLYGVQSQQQSSRALEKSFSLFQGLLSLVKPVFSKLLLLWSFSAYIYGALVSDKESQVRIDSQLANAPAVPLQPCGCLHSCLCACGRSGQVLAINKALMSHIWAVFLPISDVIFFFSFKGKSDVEPKTPEKSATHTS